MKDLYSSKPENEEHSDVTDIAIYNESALDDLAWSIEASAGKFKLLLARCNYTQVRSQLIAKLRLMLNLKWREIKLRETDTTLLTKIQQDLATNNHTDALLITGLEFVENIDHLITTTNQVREEFRKNFQFPLVLWVNDEILTKILRLAPDFESWATTTEFIITPNTLRRQLWQKISTLFAEIISCEQDLGLTNQAILGHNYRQEIQAALHDLQAQKETIEVPLKANLEVVYGREAHIKDDIDTALNHYQNSLNFWPEDNNYLRQGIALFYMGLCYCRQAEIEINNAQKNWEQAKNYFQESIDTFAKGKRQDLVAKFINSLGKVLEKLSDYNELETIALKSLELQQTYINPVRLAQVYGFLASIDLNRNNWIEAQENAKQALEIVKTNESENQQLLYLFLLARSTYNLHQYQTTINYLETARNIGVGDNPQLYINILNTLHDIYFEQKHYLLAFEVKLERLSIEQQYGLRAFVGPGWIKSQRQAKLALNKIKTKENIAPEINASGRLLDVERLIERLGRNDYKLIVIYGYSGVGKSSLVNGGLLPVLQQKSIGTADVLPITIRVYSNWIEELGQALEEAITKRRKINPENLSNLHSATAILNEIKHCETRNLRPVLIFDQFEEFFFFYPHDNDRNIFFEFLGECLNILSVKIILSLRKDYLHLLLAANSLESMKIIGNDILSKNVLYPLENFSVSDAESIINNLTKRSKFYLEPDLIKKLVKDLAGDYNQVRPIELQVVGAQMQTDKITTLAKYKEIGKKEELVKRYLNEIVSDCGAENQEIANLLLYLLTDEKGTRPLKTRSELQRDLQNLAKTEKNHKFDLVLQIFVKSGLVLILPENPEQRYQLVHDYLAVFIRQQQETKFKELLAELEKEKEQRKQSEIKLKNFLKIALICFITAGFSFTVLAILSWQSFKEAKRQRDQADIQEIKALTNSSETFFASGKTLDALIEALKAAGKLKIIPPQSEDTQISITTVLRQAVYLKPQQHPSRERNRLEDHTSWVRSIAFSPDGKILASASYDKTIKLWDVATGKIITTISGHNSAVWSVAFSPDGKIFASGSDDKTIKLWNVVTGKNIATFSGHYSPVNSVAFSPDGKILASGSEDKTIKLWNINTNKIIITIANNSPVNSVVFSPDGKILAAGGDDKTIRLWDVLSGKNLINLSGHNSSVNNIVFSPDGKIIASGSDDKTVKFWDVQTGKNIKTLSENNNNISSIAFSPNGQTFASGSTGNSIKLWDVKTGKILNTLSGHNNNVSSIAFSPDGKTLASASEDKTLKLWDVTNNKNITIFSGHNNRVWSVVFSPDDKLLASASSDNTVKLWNVKNGQNITTFSGHTSPVRSVVFSSDGKILASGSEDKNIKLWDVNSGKIITTLSGHNDMVRSIDLSPDGKILVSGSDDKTVKLWNVATGKLITTLFGHNNTVRTVAFSRDGKSVASGSEDKTIKIWEVATGNNIYTLSGHKNLVRSIAFSPDSKILASGSDDQTIKLWDVTTGENISNFAGHKDRIRTIAFSPNGKLLASGSEDKFIKIWDVSTGKTITNLAGHNNSVNSVVFSNDSKTLVAGSGNSITILWDLALEDDLVENGCNFLYNFLVVHPDVLEELHICHTPKILKEAAYTLFLQGENLIRQDSDKTKAIIKFEKALEWNPEFKFNPEQKINQLLEALSLVKTGENLIESGKTEDAINLFHQALKIDPGLNFNANYKAATLLVNKGINLIQEKENKVSEAILAYREAEKIEPTVITADNWNTLCWYGSIHRQANDVMFACEKAVTLAADDSLYINGRGLARALTGNITGAIEDFQVFIKNTDDTEKKLAQQGWINALKAGKNPFTDEELNSLR